MAVNKVEFNGNTLIDLTDSTVTPNTLMQGVTAYDRSGTLITGTATGGGGSGGSVYQDQDGYIVISDEGGESGESVTVEPLSVTANGTYTAPTGSAYSPVTVNVPSGGGGGGSASDDVIFIDYDGTIVHSYSVSEFMALTAMPSNPSHSGLVAQGWNWSLADAKEQLTAYPEAGLVIGQMYITESGDTEIDVVFADDARLSPIMTIAVNGTVTVDWGDNTTPDTVTATSLTTRQAVPHTYASKGDYTIVIHVVSGSFTFYGNTSSNALYTLLRKTATASENYVYSNTIQAIRLGEGITTISTRAFAYCYSLSSITIPNGVTGNIGDHAFYNCSCQSITIPEGVTSIEGNAFSYNSGMRFFAMPSRVTSVSTAAFYNDDCLFRIVLPRQMTTFAGNTFYGCNALTKVNIAPNGVTSIGNATFGNCQCLISITVSDEVTSIGSSAFSGCSGMKEYHFLPTTPPTLANTNAFTSIPSDCIMYVPQGCLEAYQTATNWSTYASYMQEEPA